MDDDAGEEEAQNPPFTGRWTATSSYDVYMVDAPKENSGDDKLNPVEDEPPKTEAKAQGCAKHTPNQMEQSTQHSSEVRRQSPYQELPEAKVAT